MIADGLTQQSADVTGTFCTVPIARVERINFSAPWGTPSPWLMAVNVCIHKSNAARAFYVEILECFGHPHEIRASDRAPIFFMALCRYGGTLTVISLTTSSAAICLFIRPAVTKPITSCSRGVRASNRARASETALSLMRRSRSRSER